MNASPAPHLHRPTRGEYRIALVDFDEANRDWTIRATWDRLLAGCVHPNAFHGSREWTDYMNARGARVRVLVVRDGAKVAGVVPLIRHRHQLEYTVKGRALKDGFWVADVLGSVPLVPSDPVLAPKVARAALAAFPDCDALFFESLPEQSEYGELGGASSSGLLGYCPSGFASGHLIDLRGSFREYYRALGSKMRSNAERAVRALAAASSGDVVLGRYGAPDEVDRLFTAAAQVRRRSWQRRTLGDLDDDALQSGRGGLSELARRGLLRSYVLYAHGAPCAFVIGYQVRGIYFYAVVGYDEAFAGSSPGTALLYLLLQDLFANDTPRTLSFGRGDDDYKRRFGTLEVSVGARLLFRPTLRNRIRVEQHRLFRRMTRLELSSLWKTRSRSSR